MAKIIELFTINLLDGGKGIFVRFDCKNKMKNLSKVVDSDDLVKHLREFADEIENDSKLK